MKKTIARVLWKLGLAGPAFTVRQFLWRFKPVSLFQTLRYAIGGAPDRQPMPAMWARVRVAGSPNPDWFFTSGSLAAASIADAAARQGHDVAAMARILDFGCGCGRVLRHWHGLDGVDVFGTDFQVPLLQECRRILPFVHLAANGLEPPLPFADASFDLVYCLSVFTHFDARQEALWRDEIRRVLKPGGLWMFSTQGSAYAGKLSDREHADFEAGQMVVQRADFRGFNLCMTFHPESYVRTELADGFTVADFTPSGALGNPPQDLYVLRREPAAGGQIGSMGTRAQRSA